MRFSRRSIVGLFFIVVSVLWAEAEGQRTDGVVDPLTDDDFPDENNGKSLKVKDAKLETEESEWIAYEPADFDKNELCTVLTCQSQELCLVRNNNAICSGSGNLDEIPGQKRFYKKENPDAAVAEDPEAVADFRRGGGGGGDDGQWDQQRARDKMLEHLSAVRDKAARQSERAEPNEARRRAEPDPDAPGRRTTASKRGLAQQPLSSHERHGSRMGVYQNCSEKELLAIKGRLFKWFSDIHAMQKSEAGYELPKHAISCNEDVGFMFFTVDGDKDGKLAVDELFSLDNDPHEKCVKSFLDRCDLDSDDSLSLDEWCDCFHWADDDRHEPACHAALRKHDPHDPDSFFPACDLEGYYKLDQCQSGQCWCVDKWGREFDRSRTKGKANCQRFV